MSRSCSFSFLQVAAGAKNYKEAARLSKELKSLQAQQEEAQTELEASSLMLKDLEEELQEKKEVLVSIFWSPPFSFSLLAFLTLS